MHCTPFATNQTTTPPLTIVPPSWLLARLFQRASRLNHWTMRGDALLYSMTTLPMGIHLIGPTLLFHFWMHTLAENHSLMEIAV